jgi:transcriptional regulator with XRE-family HTH domain
MKNDRNDPASVALVLLRKHMKMTQQEFAVQVLEGAITTVSRYETGNPPPRGDVLLRLAAVARDHGRPDLARIFTRVWVENLPAIVGAYLTADHFVTDVSTPSRYGLAQACLAAFLLPEKQLKAAVKGFKALVEELQPEPNPAIAALQAIAALVNKGGKK